MYKITNPCVFALSAVVLQNALVAKPIKHTVVPPIPNQVSRWSANGNGNDATGKHAMVLGGGVTYTAGVDGKAFHFDGSTQYASVPFSKDFDIQPSGQCTVCAWVRPEQVGRYQAVIVKVHKPGVWEWGIILDPQNHFYTGHNAFDVAQSTTTVEPNHWYFVAATYNDGTWVTYVNGKEEARATGQKVLTSSGGLSLAHKGEVPAPPEDPDWFAGSLDEIRFFNRALTAKEIRRLYKAVPASAKQ